jgi:hypothetical protein
MSRRRLEANRDIQLQSYLDFYKDEYVSFNVYMSCTCIFYVQKMFKIKFRIHGSVVTSLCEESSDELQEMYFYNTRTPRRNN